jgi:hypothetical protein
MAISMGNTFYKYHKLDNKNVSISEQVQMHKGISAPFFFISKGNECKSFQAKDRLVH